MIESYEFGIMVINGIVYKSDLIVYPDRVESGWWREKGHSLSMNDLKGILDFHPDIIVIGTGYHGAMDVPSETIKALASHSIEVIVQKTPQAFQTYNKQAESCLAVGAFHLTC